MEHDPANDSSVQRAFYTILRMCGDLSSDPTERFSKLVSVRRLICGGFKRHICIFDVNIVENSRRYKKQPFVLIYKGSKSRQRAFRRHWKTPKQLNPRRFAAARGTASYDLSRFKELEVSIKAAYASYRRNQTQIRREFSSGTANWSLFSRASICITSVLLACWLHFIENLLLLSTGSG